MIAALQVVPPPRAGPVRPDLHPDMGLLTIADDSVYPGALVVTVRGEVDLFTGSLLLNGLLARLHGPARQVIVDLTEVVFFGAAGLTVLAVVREAAKEVRTGLCLVAHTRPVLLPLTITGMHSAFDIYPDLAHALANSTTADQQQHSAT